MKIVVLGGGGRVGRRIAELLVARKLGEVVVADRAPGDGPPGTTRIVVDVSNDAELVRMLAEHDLVVNCVGPFDLWGGRVLDAAIEARTDYVDICDDPMPTLALLERDAAAREAGVRAVIGLGASPGLSNLLGVVAARQLDEVDLLVNYWGDPNEDVDETRVQSEADRVVAAFRSGRAALQHSIAQAKGTIPVWRDGKLGEIPGWRPVYRVEFSTGESGTFRPIGHPEPVTLPLYTKTRHCICIGTLGRGVDNVIDGVLRDIEAGTVALDQAVGEVADRIEANPSLLLSERTAPPLPALIGAIAIGRKDGEARSVVAMPGGPTDGSMSSETARPCVLGIEIFDGVSPGVHPPEGAFDVDEFLQLFSEHEWQGAAPYRLHEREGTMFELQVSE
jgi:saccharopine dehydrogenase-like NADP-dependent oxidoreductase